jgi:hypothetical protein
MAAAARLGRVGRKVVGVRVPSLAPEFRMNMFRVYWSAFNHAWFEDHEDLVEALACVAYNRDIMGHSHVIMSSQNPNQVGKMGVTQVDADYSWTKRRTNERKFNSNDAVEVPLDEE